MVNGAGAATGVVVTDTLPVGLTFVSASDGGVWMLTPGLLPGLWVIWLLGLVYSYCDCYCDW